MSQLGILALLTPCGFTYLYGEIRPISSIIEYPRGDFGISTWISIFPDMASYRYVAGSKLL